MPKVATKKRQKWYAVRIGRQPGVYETWAEAEAQVSLIAYVTSVIMSWKYSRRRTSLELYIKYYLITTLPWSVKLAGVYLRHWLYDCGISWVGLDFPYWIFEITVDSDYPSGQTKLAEILQGRASRRQAWLETEFCWYCQERYKLVHHRASSERNSFNIGWSGSLGPAVTDTREHPEWREFLLHRLGRDG